MERNDLAVNNNGWEVKKHKKNTRRPFMMMRLGIMIRYGEETRFFIIDITIEPCIGLREQVV